MTLVEELRKRAAATREYAEDIRTAPATLTDGEREVYATGADRIAQAYVDAADLLEADPLYKSAPAMLELLREARSHLGDGDRPHARLKKRIDELLVSFPKETPK